MEADPAGGGQALERRRLRPGRNDHPERGAAIRGKAGQRSDYQVVSLGPGRPAHGEDFEATVSRSGLEAGCVDAEGADARRARVGGPDPLPGVDGVDRDHRGGACAAQVGGAKPGQDKAVLEHAQRSQGRPALCQAVPVLGQGRQLEPDSQHLLTVVQARRLTQPAQQVGRLGHGIGVGHDHLVSAGADVFGHAPVHCLQRSEEDVGARRVVPLAQPTVEQSGQGTERIAVNRVD